MVIRLLHKRIYEKAVAMEQHSAAVGCGARRSFGSNDTARPGTVLNCESYAVRPSDLLRQHAGDKIVGCPGRNWNDNLDG